MAKRSYVDGYIIPIKKSNVSKYKKLAMIGRKMWMKHGALDYYECIGDDLKSHGWLSFLKLCKLKANETVVFAFVTYKSKAHRNQVNKKVMNDSGIETDMKMPFDMKRFTMGGFKILVSAKKG